MVDFNGGGFNIVKFLLSVIAMFFDLIFMFQHYVLYRDKWVAVKEAKKLEKTQLTRMNKLNQYDPV